MDRWLDMLGAVDGRLWWGNTPQQWTVAIAAATLVMLAWFLLRAHVARRARQLAASSAPSGIRLVSALVAQVKVFPLLALSLALASKSLVFPPPVETLATDVIVILLALQCGVWATTALRFWLREQHAGVAGGEARPETPTLTIVDFVARVLIWTLVGLVALDNLGVNITALLTGLGIGGIAVALAVQNVLGDLFASLSIALDKPFLPGDTIEVDTVSGVVEHVGIKSTRIRSGSGELVIVANADLLRSRVRNYGRALERRKLFPLCVSYGVPVERMRDVPAMVESVVRSRPGVRFERCHLRLLGENGAVFEVAFHSESPDFEALALAEHEVNLRLLEVFAREGITLAYPTRTVMMARSGGGVSGSGSGA